MTANADINTDFAGCRWVLPALPISWQQCWQVVLIMAKWMAEQQKASCHGSVIAVACCRWRPPTPTILRAKPNSIYGRANFHLILILLGNASDGQSAISPSKLKGNQVFNDTSIFKKPIYAHKTFIKKCCHRQHLIVLQIFSVFLGKIFNLAHFLNFHFNFQA